MTPRIAVNLLWCVPGDVGGSEQYLVRQLSGLDGGSPVPVTLYVPGGFGPQHPELADLAMIEAPFDGTNRPRRILGESTWLRRRTRSAALVHHGGGTAPLGARRPYVLTVHDLQYLTFPQYFSRRKRWYLAAMIRRSVRGATLVTVPSAYVASTVVSAFGVAADRVCVVRHGVEPAVATDVAVEADLRQRYELGAGPIVVYPAATWPHKNHRFLINMMLRRWTEPDLRLVLIGGIGSSEGDVATDDQRVRRLGRVSDADRNGLLAMADALVFPSLYEGFGAPIIEAMALGTPVLCSDATCLPDLVGGAGIVLPLEEQAWADALTEARGRRREFAAAGRARAQEFTSAKSGVDLTAAYRRALELP